MVYFQKQKQLKIIKKANNQEKHSKNKLNIVGSSSDTTLSWTVLLTIGGALLWTKCVFNVKPTALDVGSMNNILALTYTRTVSDHPDTKKI